jgi:hypothetical protein
VFAHDLHVALTSATLVGFLAAAIEGGIRAVHRGEAGGAARAGLNISVVLVGMTAAAGLAMLVRGDRPLEWLHVLYALLVFGMIPALDSVALQAGPRAQGFARFAGGVLGLVVIARLFATG